jgi:hypothetical protein
MALVMKCDQCGELIENETNPVQLNEWAYDEKGMIDSEKSKSYDFCSWVCHFRWSLRHEEDTARKQEGK